ncbi:MAG: F0F1 ATP synthase subunit gamma [Hyphomicrobiaceae bacterium]|nr:F0F1 ATP synthase subunit gamma [Hyphomicrobiaceae bacterium]
MESLDQLRRLFSAMRAISALRVQEAVSALSGIRRYAQVVEGAISSAANLKPEAGIEWIGDETQGSAVLVAICAEQGFAGLFNRAVLEQAKSVLAPGEQLGIVGRRGGTLAAESGFEPHWTLPMATHVGGIITTARHVAGNLLDATSVRLVYACYQKGGHFDVVVRPVIPISLDLLKRVSNQPPPLHHLDPQVLLRQLIEEHLFADLVLALMESLASENGNRLNVMKAADNNIEEKLDGLQRHANQVRQQSITSEILDIVTGAEAIMETAAGAKSD